MYGKDVKLLVSSSVAVWIDLRRAFGESNRGGAAPPPPVRDVIICQGKFIASLQLMCPPKQSDYRYWSRIFESNYRSR